MKVSKLMSRKLIAVGPMDAVEEASGLLRRRGVRHLLVLRRGRLVGIISDRDLKRALDPSKTQKKVMNVGGLYFLLEPILVEEIMTPKPRTIGPNTSAHEAASIMVKNKFGALPVVDGPKVLGIVTETDLLRYFASQPAPEVVKPAKKGINKSAVRKKRTTKKMGRGK